MNLSVLFFLLLSQTTFAKAPVQLWKEWYIYSVGGVAQGYFQESAEKRTVEKEIAISQDWVEAGEGMTKTFIGSVSKDDDKLTPVAFFSERTSAAKITKLDGRIKGKNVELTFKTEKPAGVKIKKTVPLKSSTYLGNFVGPMLMKKPLGKAVEFTAIVEDARDGKFESRAGVATVLGMTKQFKGNNCRRVQMAFDGVESEWWVTSEGKLCELNIPSNQARLRLATEEEARKSLTP